MTINKLSILVVVPIYNEESNIAEVINSLIDNNLDLDILLINDGSTDRSKEICNNYSTCKLINLPFNIGIGGAVQTGFIYAIRNDYNIVVQCDGDGQHLSSEIRKIINPIINGEADVVVGSRFINKIGYKSTFTRRIGIKIISAFIRILTKNDIKDVTSGFRAFNKNSISFLSKDYSVDYPEPESLISLHKNNFTIKEEPVKMKDRIGGKSSISFIRSIYYIIKVLLAISIMFFKQYKIKL